VSAFHHLGHWRQPLIERDSPLQRQALSVVKFSLRTHGRRAKASVVAEP
jgi:hypothetical protein